MFSYRDIRIDHTYFGRLVLWVCPLGRPRANTATTLRDAVVYHDLTLRHDPETSPQHTTTAELFAQWVRRQIAKKKRGQNS